MAKSHGARQQKKVAKQKAKRSDKRTDLIRRSSNDPTIRLQRAEKWPVVHAYVGQRLWEDGIGHLVIARQESEGRLIFGVYLVDVYCLGVKDAFWRAGTNGDLRDLIRKMETTQTMSPISPACLVKIVKGSVDYALSFGLRPHPDFRHASMLLEGIDPSTCPHEYTFGRDGKPFYIQGPYDSPEVARAILERIHASGGHFLVQGPESGMEGLVDMDEDEEDPPRMLEP
jgi:hypothetical protein